MPTIAFIGLGTMGLPMAANLLRKSYAVVVYNRSPGKAGELLELGAEEADTPLAAARNADVVVTMISNDAAVEEVYYGSEGVFAGLKPGTVLIDSSTISPALARRLARDAADAFCDFLDAPVTGSKPAAIDGTLLFMAGGDAQIVEDQKPLLLSMGREVLYMGPSGSGAAAKLAHNTIVGINAAGLVEGMAIAAKAGIDASSFLRVVQGGGAASKQAELKGRKIIEHDFSVQFSLALMLKDLKLSSVLTDGLGVPTPMLEASKSLFQAGAAAGYGEEDLAALAKLYEQWIGGRIGADSRAEAETSAAAETTAAAESESDRRKQKRVALNIPLMISIYQWQEAGSFAGQSVEAVLSDVSEDGLQIASSIPLEKDMFVVIHFQQETSLPPMTARIIRIERKEGLFHYGCLLSGLALYQRLQLKEYIESHG
ncbi:2-hydroxy-3-oxopropionate reductase [Cohnella sp. JJ-181]|nr:2-hydroxy-3-oxopropionate reductase [Cohnella sp. JJ-181]